jgi:hypothetical protein
MAGTVQVNIEEAGILLCQVPPVKSGTFPTNSSHCRSSRRDRLCVARASFVDCTPHGLQPGGESVGIVCVAVLQLRE